MIKNQWSLICIKLKRFEQTTRTSKRNIDLIRVSSRGSSSFIDRHHNDVRCNKARGTVRSFHWPASWGFIVTQRCRTPDPSHSTFYGTNLSKVGIARYSIEFQFDHRPLSVPRVRERQKQPGSGFTQPESLTSSSNYTRRFFCFRRQSWNSNFNLRLDFKSALSLSTVVLQSDQVALFSTTFLLCTSVKIPCKGFSKKRNGKKKRRKKMVVVFCHKTCRKKF